MGSPMALVEIGKGLSEHQLVSDELWSGPLPLSEPPRGALPAPGEGAAGRYAGAPACRGGRILGRPITDRIGCVRAGSPLGRGRRRRGGRRDRPRRTRFASATRSCDRLSTAAPRSSIAAAPTRSSPRPAAPSAISTGELGTSARRPPTPTEAVAAELHQAAERALLRGGCAASAAFFTRSAELTPDRATRAERALAAAERHLIAGFRVRSRRVLDEFADDITDPHQRARASRLEGNIRYTIGEVDGTVGLLLDAAKTYAPLDIQAARDTLLDALAAARIPGALEPPWRTHVRRRLGSPRDARSRRA